MGIFFPNIHKSDLIGYSDVGYLSDPRNGKSQASYLYMYGDTILSW